ncbi:MAG: hypothetical protein JRD89_01140 [Deltaproteobacteria bacterium]|nr:hypothetical protein [Deltaproteobacteria bacterium]
MHWYTYQGGSLTNITDRLLGSWDVDISAPNVDASQWVNGSSFKLNKDLFYGAYNRTPVIKYPEQPASYIVFKEGSTIYAKNGTTGEIDFSGTDAATVMQAAIDALTSGGVIFIKAETYYLTAPITIAKNNLIIEGEGERTLITQADGQNLAYFFKLSGPTTHTPTYIKIRNLRLEGNYNNNTNTIGIGAPPDRHPDYIWVQNCHIAHFSGECIKARGNVWTVTNNYISESKTNVVYHSGADSIYANNQIGGASGASGSCFYGSALSHIIIANNKIFGAQDYHIYLDAPYRCVIAGNIIGGTAPTPQYDSLHLRSYTAGRTYCVITGNLFYGADRDGVRLHGNPVDYNVIVGNLFDGYGGSAVREVDAPDYNLISGNQFQNITGSPVVKLGANTKVEGNVGYITENSGTATNTTSTTFVFNHGLAGTPTFVSASFNTTAIDAWTWTATSTQITITVTPALTSPATCYWEAKYVP